MAWVLGMNPADAVFCELGWGGGGGGGGGRSPHMIFSLEEQGIVRLLHLFNAKLLPGEALAGRRDHWRCGRCGKGGGGGG